MDVKEIKLDDNRGGVLAVAFTNGTDKTPDKIKGGWFSGFNNNVTRRSTNRAGNDVGITGKELLNGAKTLGGSWVANSKVDYEYRVVEEKGPVTCSNYRQLRDIPYELSKLIRDTYGNSRGNPHSLATPAWEIVDFLNSGATVYDESEEFIAKNARYDFSREKEGIRWDAYNQIANITLCIQRIYLVTPTERTLKETKITKLTYTHFRGEILSHNEDSNGIIHIPVEERFIFSDVITGERRLLSTRRRTLHAR